MMKIRILIVDDHAVVRDGLKFVIRQQPDMEVAGEADNGKDAIAAAFELSPDLIIMDVEMSDMNGIEVSRQVLQKAPQTKIVILSAYPDPAFVSDAVALGLHGYVLKANTSKELLHVIRTVIEGKQYFCPDVARVMASNYKSLLEARNSAPKPQISERELEVLKLIANGMRTKEIAAKLCLGSKTVETHRANLMRKLHCGSQVALTRYAIREGIVSL